MPNKFFVFVDSTFFEMHVAFFVSDIVTPVKGGDRQFLVKADMCLGPVPSSETLKHPKG